MTENKRFTLDEYWNIDDSYEQEIYHGGEDCRELCELLNVLDDENEQLKSELESAMGEINHCHLIIETLVENEGVNDYFDLLNKCDKELLKEMGWE